MELFRPLSDVGVTRRPTGPLSWFAIWAAVSAVGAILTPDPHGHGTHQQLGLPPCPSVMLFDRPCPGCGLTTSWSALLHGQIGFAFHAHPLGPVLYLGFTLSAWLGLYAWATHRTVVTDTPAFNRAATVGALIFVGFGLVRMAVTPHFGTANERVMVNLARQFGK